MEIELDEIVRSFRRDIEVLLKKYNLDEGNIIVKLDPNGPIGGMRKSLHGERIPDVGFISELKVILVQDH